MNALKVILATIVVLAAALLPFSVFTVNMMEKAVLLEFRKVKAANFEPGLHWKIPFVQQVVKFDKRLLSLDSKPERFLTKGKKFLSVDSYVMWRIESEEAYYTSTGGDEFTAQRLLSQKVNAGLRDEFGRRELAEVVSGERREVMDILRRQVEENSKQLGIAIVDVRIKRIDFPDDVSDKVYARMRAERLRVSNDYRSRGEEAAEKIRADADRERTGILAAGYREAQEVRGQGDAIAAETYADAYSKNEEFFNLYRSLQAYRKTFQGHGDVMVLEPDSEFFRYFNNATGAAD